MPEAVRGLARENTEIAEKLGESRERQKELIAAAETAAASFETLQAVFSGVKQRVELAGLNETIGLALRQQRSRLPNLRSYRRTARDRAREMSALAEQQFENDARRRSLTDLAERMPEIVASRDPSLPHIS